MRYTINISTGTDEGQLTTDGFDPIRLNCGGGVRVSRISSEGETMEWNTPLPSFNSAMMQFQRRGDRTSTDRE